MDENEHYRIVSELQVDLDTWIAKYNDLYEHTRMVRDSAYSLAATCRVFKRVIEHDFIKAISQLETKVRMMEEVLRARQSN